MSGPPPEPRRPKPAETEGGGCGPAVLALIVAAVGARALAG